MLFSIVKGKLLRPTALNLLVLMARSPSRELVVTGAGALSSLSGGRSPVSPHSWEICYCGRHLTGRCLNLSVFFISLTVVCFARAVRHLGSECKMGSFAISGMDVLHPSSGGILWLMSPWLGGGRT